jgi:hypothetical protein
VSEKGFGDGASFTVTGPLWLWTGEKGSWHFFTVPQDTASDIRLRNMAQTGGFGSIRVEAKVGDVAWRTSIFPVKRTGEYILAVKADVRRRAGISAGDEVVLSLELI